MRTIIVLQIVILLAVICQTNATTVGIAQVDIAPNRPFYTDIITFDILGRASSGPSEVKYDQFTQDGTLLQLDLYVDMGFMTIISNWNHSRQISPLSAETYTLEVRAFDYQLGTLQDTYNVNFTVVPEPATLALFGFGLLILKPLSRRKGRGLNV